jgi:hypothetical protein
VKLKERGKVKDENVVVERKGRRKEGREEAPFRTTNMILFATSYTL